MLMAYFETFQRYSLPVSQSYPMHSAKPSVSASIYLSAMWEDWKSFAMIVEFRAGDGDKCKDMWMTVRLFVLFLYQVCWNHAIYYQEVLDKLAWNTINCDIVMIDDVIKWYIDVSLGSSGKIL